MVSFGVDFESGGWVFENLATGEISDHRERNKETTKTIYEVRPGTCPHLCQGQGVLTRGVRPMGALVRSRLAWSKLRPASSIGADFVILLDDRFGVVTPSRRAEQRLVVGIL